MEDKKEEQPKVENPPAPNNPEANNKDQKDAPKVENPPAPNNPEANNQAQKDAPKQEDNNPKPEKPKLNTKMFAGLKSSNNNNNEHHKEEEKKEEGQPQPQGQASNNLIPDEKNTKELINAKITSFRHNYQLAINYITCLSDILKFFMRIYIEKLNGTLFDDKSIISFFQRTADMYKEFALSIKKFNTAFNPPGNKPKLYSNRMKNVLSQTYDSLISSFDDISNQIKNKITVKGPLFKIEGAFASIEKKRDSIGEAIYKFEVERKALEKLYNNKFEKLFSQILPPPVEPGRPIQPAALANAPIETIVDFYEVDKDLGNEINKVFAKGSLLVTEVKDKLYNINKEEQEITKALQTASTLYMDENRKIYGTEIMMKFSQLQQFGTTGNDSNVEDLYNLLLIFNEEEHSNGINQLLEKYQKLLLNTKCTKSEIINSPEKMRIGCFDKIESFYEMLLSVNPNGMAEDRKQFVVAEFKIKRDPGLFAKWRDCYLIFTAQRHMLVYDENENGNYVYIFEMSNVTFRGKVDKKRKFLFEIVVNKKGKIMNTSGTHVYDALDEQNYAKIMDIYKK